MINYLRQVQELSLLFSFTTSFVSNTALITNPLFNMPVTLSKNLHNLQFSFLHLFLHNLVLNIKERA
jgi:hypothetical protein